MSEYFAGEDFPVGVNVYADTDEEALKLGNEKLAQAWEIIKAAFDEAGLGMWIGVRYDEDLRINIDDEETGTVVTVYEEGHFLR